MKKKPKLKWKSLCGGRIFAFEAKGVCYAKVYLATGEADKASGWDAYVAWTKIGLDDFPFSADNLPETSDKAMLACEKIMRRHLKPYTSLQEKLDGEPKLKCKART